jgi:hypothetical protein
MANRVEAGIAKFNEVIKAKLASGEITQSKLDEMNQSLDMDFDEYCKFQNAKSIASMDGRLSLEEAQTVYRYLGEMPSTFNGQTLAVKYVLTEVWGTLLKAMVR